MLNLLKGIISIIIITFSITSCSAQIRPLEQKAIDVHNQTEVPDGVYYKDINLILTPFVGVWKGNYRNREIVMHVEKYTDAFLGIQIDNLRIRYTITKANGEVVYSTINLPDDAYLLIDGSYLSDNNETYFLNYHGEEHLCGQEGEIAMAVVENGTKINLTLIPETELWPSDCTDYNVEFYFPTPYTSPNKMTLTKQ